DKIVQIPFRIPPPSPQDVQGFLTLQLRATQQAGAERSLGKPAAGSDRESSLPGGLSAETGQPSPPAATLQGAGSRPALVETAEERVAFTDEEIAAFEELATFLEPNPRHLKRIVNVYRLVRSLAMVRNERFVLEDPAGTIRLLALAAQWPFTLSAMFE